MIEIRRQTDGRTSRDADLDRMIRADVSAGEAFVAYALERAGVPEDEREGRWMGGLAVPFGETYMPEGLAWGERFDPGAFDESLAEVAAGTHRVSVCSSHDCTVGSGLLASTGAAPEMRAYYWAEKEDIDGREAGLYVLARVAETDGSPAKRVADQIELGGVAGISIGFRVREERVDEVREEVPIYRVMRVGLFESSPADHPAYGRTWTTVGEARPGSHSPDDREAWISDRRGPRTADRDGGMEHRCSGTAAAEISALREEINTRIEELASKIDRKRPPAEVLAVPS